MEKEHNNTSAAGSAGHAALTFDSIRWCCRRHAIESITQSKWACTTRCPMLPYTDGCRRPVPPCGWRVTFALAPTQEAAAVAISALDWSGVGITEPSAAAGIKTLQHTRLPRLLQHTSTDDRSLLSWCRKEVGGAATASSLLNASLLWLNGALWALHDGAAAAATHVSAHMT